jgi:putative hydrolase of the HAD superfamily
VFLLVSSWHVFPDAVPALEALRARGLAIGAVSNWIWQLPELLHSLELVSHFDFVAASARVGFEKPHAGIFQHALQQAGVRPREALHVGDHIDADVQGAQAVGISPVLIDRRERYTEVDVPQGVPLIRSLSELVGIVDARLQRASA